VAQRNAICLAISAIAKRALPARALLHQAATLLLGSKACDAARAMGESRKAVQAHPRASSHRLAQRLGRLF
jgi:hypothetical protein